MKKKDKITFKSQVPSRGGISKSKFIEITLRNFKKVLGKKCHIPHDKQVLVAYSGGPSSTFLLQILDETITSSETIQKNPKFRKILLKRKNFIFFKYCVLYVDVSQLFDVKFKIEEMKENLKKFKSIEKFFVIPFPKHYVQLLQSFRELSAKEDLFNILIQRTIIDFAKKNKFEYILLGHSATRLSVQAISGICKGRAANIHENVQLCGKIENLKIIKPLKNFYQKEIVYFNYIRKVKTFFVPTFSTKKSIKGSTVDNLVEYYLLKILKNKPDSTFTVLRTCEKLKGLNEKIEKVRNCEICNVAFDSNTRFCYGCERNLQFKKKNEIIDSFIVSK